MSLAYEYLPATTCAEQELVLLHGWGCDREVWRSLLVLLRPLASITLVDIPGCDPGSDSAVVPELTDVLAGILSCSPAKAVYVGWSLGGQLALALADRAPERVAGVITFCSNPRFVATGNWPGMDAHTFREFCAGFARNPGKALRRFRSLQVAGAAHPRRLLRQLEQPAAAVVSDALQAGLGWLETLDQRELLARMTQPQLHVLAENDGLLPPDLGAALSAQIPEVNTHPPVVLAQSCHLAPLEAPTDMECHIREFLSAHSAASERQPATTQVQKKDVAASFSRAALLYDSAAHLQREVGERLLSFLDCHSRTPATVLDLGCGTGHFRDSLSECYPEAQYLGLDLAEGMVRYARVHADAAADWVVADAEALPLAAESVDVIFSSLALQWCFRPDHLFAELTRILRPGGRCVFATLGPETLWELRAAWAAVDTHQHVNTFLPTSALEDAIARAPGTRLTLQREVFGMQYARVRDLLDELKALGAHNMNPDRPTGLTSRRALQGMLQAYESFREDGVLPASYDVVFGVLEKS